MMEPPFLPTQILPEELIAEILRRLPVRPLLQFKSVCKSWKTLISSPQFVKNHLHNSISDTSLTHQRLVSITNDASNYSTICSVKPLFDSPSSPPETLTFQVLPYSHFLIVGSCNGLICFFDFRGYYILWNPSTRLTFERSPHSMSEGVNSHIGFGFDLVNNKYKVLVINCGFPNDIETKVYTFGTDSWTTIQNQNPPCAMKNIFGKFASSTLNWLAEKGDVIVSFDLENETYGKVLLPPQTEADSIDVLSNCLCVCCFSETPCLVVWLMKKYGVQESWTKLWTLIPHENSVLRPLCVSENGIVLAQCSGPQLVLYEPNARTFSYPNVEGIFGMGTIHIYHESLVSP